MTNPENKTQAENKDLYRLPPTIPLFDRYEIKFGAILGSGAFCTVCAISNIIPNERNRLYDDVDDEGDHYDTSENDHDESKDELIQKSQRQRLIQQFEENRSGSGSTGPGLLDGSDPNKKPPPRYAIKYLKRGLSSKDRERGTQDLEMELNLLLKCRDHPNIITLLGVGGNIMVDLNLKGVTSSSSLLVSSSKKCDRFLILDRLRSTLEKRFYRWREKRGVGIFEALAINEKENQNLWLERMVILSKIASAVYFLHQTGIIYRDLKPENIGFDFDNTPKLFDFGLARTLPTNSNPENTNIMAGNIDNEAYKLTGMTGSPRYMAPEVALAEPYGTNADVYSFSILMHEVLSLKVPYAGVTGIRTLHHQVVQEGRRPPIDPLWPDSIGSLLMEMWDGNRRKRPDSGEVLKRLGDLLRGRDEDLFPSWGVKRWFRGT